MTTLTIENSYQQRNLPRRQRVSVGESIFPERGPVYFVEAAGWLSMEESVALRDHLTMLIDAAEAKSAEAKKAADLDSLRAADVLIRVTETGRYRWTRGEDGFFHHGDWADAPGYSADDLLDDKSSDPTVELIPVSIETITDTTETEVALTYADDWTTATRVVDGEGDDWYLGENGFGLTPGLYGDQTLDQIAEDYQGIRAAFRTETTTTTREIEVEGAPIHAAA